MLKTNNLNAFYGEAQVLNNISINVEQGQVVVMLGPNGHGKSTLLKAICGLAARVEGQIRYQGEEIQGLRAEKIVNLADMGLGNYQKVFH